jgi:hypothetical protein
MGGRYGRNRKKVTDISNFGSFGQGLRHYADLNGCVPEQGDEPWEFQWDHDRFDRDFDCQGNGYEGYAAETWAAFIGEAVRATREAKAALDEWRS